MPMSAQDTIDMMRRTAADIRTLRRTIEVLAPKAEAYDAIITVLGFSARRAETMSEDLASRLEQKAEALEQEEKAQNTTEEAGPQ